MTIQSNVQQLLQAGTGLQTTAQSGTPSGVNTGNPNSVYNWSSYIPSILRNAQGTPTGANFDLLTSQPTASSPGTGGNTGYTPPFTADPFAAMLMSQLAAYRGPSASQLPGYGSGNSMVDNILRNLIGNYVASPPPGSATPPAGGTAPPVVTPPVTAPPAAGTAPPAAGAPQPLPGSIGAGVGDINGQLPPNVEGVPIYRAPVYNNNPNTGGGGTGGTGGNLPTGTAPYIPNYGNFDNTGTVGPIWGNDPYGNNFSTGGTGAPANQGGGFRGGLTGALNAIAPPDASSGGRFMDFLANLGERTGFTTGNIADITATTGSSGLAVVPGAIQDAGAGFISGWRGSPVNIDTANGSANNFGFGDVSGGWNANDVYSPTIVNPDFSLGNEPTASISDVLAYLEQMRANEPAPGTAPPATTAPTTTEPVNAQGRTAQQEAEYRAGLDMQSNLSAQRYGENIAFNGSPLTPSTRQV